MCEKYKHKLPGQFLYENMLLCDAFPLEKVLRVKALELEPTDVVVASYPKTGTTFLQEIVWLIRNNGDTDKASETLNIARVPFMELGYRNNFEIFANLLHPRHMKTHLPYSFLPITAREGRAKIVYIIRNPKDCLVSYYYFHRTSMGLGHFSGTWDDFFEYYRENDYILNFGNQFEHMRGYWEHKDDDNLHIVFFEDLIKEPQKTIANIAEFLQCQLSDEILDKIVTATKFDVMKTNPNTNMDFGPKTALERSSPFMRKGQIGDWKNYFNEEQNRIMAEMEKEKLSGTDMKFVYE